MHRTLHAELDRLQQKNFSGLDMGLPSHMYLNAPDVG